MRDIFYTPHMDDETIAMGGAIAKCVLAGERPIVVLLTDSLASPRMVKLLTGLKRCPIHQGEKHYLSGNLNDARRAEFLDAMTVLGVHRDDLHTVCIPEVLVKDDRVEFVERVRALMERYERRYPGATHHCIAGMRDIHEETRLPAATHVACAAAARQVAHAQTVVFHLVYIYSFPLPTRRADVVTALGPEVMARKRAALDAYSQWWPDCGQYAYARHSVPDLIIGAEHDPREFTYFAQEITVRVYHDDALTLYDGDAVGYCDNDRIDLVFTNPYSHLPPLVHAKPMLIHQWTHRQAEAELWCGQKLELVSLWNEGREAVWAANMKAIPVDLSDLVPEPGGWYPPALPERLLGVYARKGDTIWDGFMGRGTTAKVARDLGMKFIGVEILPEHMAIARQYLGIEQRVPEREVAGGPLR